MSSVSSETSFHPELLSIREREVLDLAVEGYTDEQMAQALNLSVSTVNSYWVRIRGKLGQMSRTEIVAATLRHDFKNIHQGLVAEVARLKGQLSDCANQLARARADLQAQTGGAWHLLALQFVPEAVLVAEHPGDVMYANLQAERLLHAEPGRLVGRPVCELTAHAEREARRRRIREFLELGIPGRFVMGVEEPCYIQADDGTNFRATIAVEGFCAPHGFMAVFTVRELLGDIDAVIRTLRRPLVFD